MNLGEFRKLTQNLPDDTIIGIPDIPDHPERFITVSDHQIVRINHYEDEFCFQKDSLSGNRDAIVLGFSTVDIKENKSLIDEDQE